MKSNRLTCFLGVMFMLCMSVTSFCIDVPPKVSLYEPVVITHTEGAKIQILPWGTATPQFLDESRIKRFKDHTVFGAPAGAYLVSGDGQIAIVIIEGVGPKPPGPLPPDPNPPGPDPGPNPPQPDGRDCSKVPEDRFGNIGKLACQSMSLVSQEDSQRYTPLVREAYLKTAEAMKNPSSGVLSLDDGTKFLADRLKEVFPAGPQSWSKWAEKMNAHIKTQTITRIDFGPMCASIAEGLK